jgi:hypothetical protein
VIFDCADVDMGFVIFHGEDSRPDQQSTLQQNTSIHFIE